MQIESVHIQNLRSMEDVTVQFGDYTCLVGPNGAGKSNILCALNIFFRETEDCPLDLCALEEEDFHCKNTAEPVVITVTFTDLSDEAKQDFADYCRQDRLVVSVVAEFDDSTRKADVKQYGQRLGIRAFADFFKAEGDNAKVAELKEIYGRLKADFPELPPPRTRDSMIQALHDYESRHPDACELIRSEDQFYGWTRGSNRLAKYVQWVPIPAVKDASAEQLEGRDTALGKLLARTVRARTHFGDKLEGFREDWRREYQQLLAENQDALDEISIALRRRLSEWSHPGASLRLEWREDPDRSVRVEEPWAHVIAGEGPFEGQLARFGHGLQRSYLLALLQELSGSEDLEGPTLILSCEEPELYQHPPQARHLFSVLQKLSQGNSQVIICTHSPYFVSGQRFEDIRMIRKEDACSTVSQVTYEQIGDAIAAATGSQPTRPSGMLAKLHQALQPSLGEMFFTTRLVLVEGLEDAAYVATYLNLMDLWHEYRRSGCHMVPTDGKSGMIQPVAIAKALGIPIYVIFDADGDKPDKNGSRSKHEKDNLALLRLQGVNSGEAFPQTTLWGEGVTVWSSEIGAVVHDEIGKEHWERYCAKADQTYGYAGGLQKNALHIGMSLALAWEDGRTSTSLEKLCRELLEFARGR